MKGIFLKLNKKIKYWLFLYKKPVKKLNPRVKNRVSVVLLTIAYNEAELIRNQITLLKKYFHNPFTHWIVDNSSNPDVRKKIQKICLDEEVGYAGVPPNPYSANKSHAAAMHWAYFQLIRGKNVKCFGFLDHDIFPLKSYSLSEKMKNGIYGRVMHQYTREGYQSAISPKYPYWSLWAGFCFFERSVFTGIFPWSLNFFSKHFKDGSFLDTGGGLWKHVYRKIAYPDNLATYRLMKYSDKELEGIQNQSFEILDDSWIHFVSLSNWRESPNLEEKKQKFQEILSEHLNQYKNRLF